jgi:glycosyltransferase involved in cell wall biosynthesis
MTERTGSRPVLLFVVNHAAFFVSHRLPIAEAAREAGFEVRIATGYPGSPRDHSAVANIERRGFSFHGLRLMRSGLNPLAELLAVRDIVALYRKIRPSIVHHVALKAVLYGTIAARITRTPAVVNAVSGLGFAFLDESLRGKIRRGLLKEALRTMLGHPHTRAIFQNDDDAGVFVRSRIVREDQIRVIRGSGVDVQEFPASPMPSGVPVVVFPARMLRDKGLFEFVAAARALKNKGIHARFVLAGGIDENRAGVSRRIVEDWQAEGTVEWWGHCENMAAVFQGSALVVLPSYREGLPKALLEAAASGRAVITTDVPGCRDAISPNTTGLLVPSHDIASLAAAMERLLTDRALAEKMGVAARRNAEERFSIQRVCAETLDVYGELLRIRPPIDTAPARRVS